MESARARKFKALLSRVQPLQDTPRVHSQLPNTHSDLHSHEITYHPQDSFNSATHFPILIYQIICFSPWKMAQADSQAVKGFSYRQAICVVTIVMQVIMAVLSFIRLNIGGMSIFKSGSVLYFGGAAVSMLLLMRVSNKWRLMVSQWEQVEGYIGEQRYLRVKFLALSVLVIVPAIVSHVVYLPSGFLFFHNRPVSSMFQYYIVRKFPQVYEHIPYSSWSAGLVLLVNFASNMTYCFVDQIILMSSLALVGYFQQFNRILFKYKNTVLRPAEWKTLRMNYIRLCTLTSQVDDCLCHLLCLTFIIHVYILCVYAHLVILNRNKKAERIHVIVSFLVNLTRFLALCVTTVKVYEQSKIPLTVLYGVRGDSYCTEVELFTQQVLSNNVCLSGSHMFSMNRNFLLTIAGTIITFLLLLMQLKDIAANI